MQNFQCWLLKTIFLKGDMKRLKKDVKPTNAEPIFSNENYCEDGDKRHDFDVLAPTGSEGKLPCIFNVHGGGFCAGSKEIYDNYARRMAAEGFVVVNLNYSLTPKYPFPSAILDCVAAINYCLERKDKYRIGDEYFVMGDSAGANLAATMGVIATNPEYARLFGVELVKKPTGLYLSCGCYTFETDKEKSPMDFGVMYFQKKRKDFPDRKYYEIYDGMTADFPPTFLTSCADDFLFADNVRMKAKLDELNVKNVALFFDETHKPLGHVYNYRYISDDGRVFPEAEEAKRVSTEFFKELIASGK